MNKYQTEEFPDGKGHQRHGSATFYSLLEEMAATHDRKSHDYATSDKPFINYEFAGTIANLFSHSAIDAGFAGRLAEKIMRLSVLEKGGLQPKNESVADTERDIAVIATLWMAARKDKQLNEQVAMPETTAREYSKIFNVSTGTINGLMSEDVEQRNSVSIDAVKSIYADSKRLTIKDLERVIKSLKMDHLNRTVNE